MKFSIEHVKLFVLAGLLFVLPLSKALVSVFCVLFLLLFLIEFRSIRQHWKSKLLLLLPVFYFSWHLMGMLWTTNSSFGWQDLSIKFPLLIFPLGIVAYRELLQQRFALIKTVFFAGLFCALLYCFILAISRFLNTGDIGEFFYTSFSRLIHPSYFAWFLDMAMVLVIFDTRSKDKKHKPVLFLFAVFFSASVLLLNSKAGIIGWLLAVLLSYAWQSWQLGSRRSAFTGIFWSVLFLVSLQWLVPTSVNRMETMRKVVAEKKDDYAEAESSSTRLQVWEQTVRLIKEQPLLGTGTGDVKDELVAAYVKADMKFAAERRFNAHNQFLQSWLTLGVIGFLLFALLLILPLRAAFLDRNPLLFIFILLAAFNMLVESMLEKQAGVVFFALFYSLFLLLDFKSKSVAQL